MHLAEIMTVSCSEFCRRLYPDLLPTDSPGNRITPAASTPRNLELRNTETCGKYRRDINQSLLETFFFSSLFHIRYWRWRSINRRGSSREINANVNLEIVHFSGNRRNDFNACCWRFCDRETHHRSR